MQEQHNQTKMPHEGKNDPSCCPEPKQDIEKLLALGNAVQFKPQGYSMYPLFVPGRDEAVVAPVGANRLKRGDVVLYRRDKSILVLHRIWKRKGDLFYLVGDNQREIEGPLRPDQIKGILVQVIRKGRQFSAGNIIYRTLAGIWLWLRPMRPFLSHIVAGCKRILGSKHKLSGDKP